MADQGLTFEFTPLDMNRMYMLGQFMRKVKFDRSGCWLWQAYREPEGYGKWQVTGTRRKTLAHRFAYEQFVGDIPPEYHIDHLCHNPACVNPTHLEAVTPQTNFARMRERQQELKDREKELYA